MNDSHLGEVTLEQIPKAYRPDNKKHRSYTAFLIVIFIIILFGIFWFIESKKSEPVFTNPAITDQNTLIKNRTSNLGASVEAIEIPSYSDSI